MKRITRTEGLELFSNADLLGLGMLADKTCRQLHPDFVIDRNINYTNICINRCSFCAFWRDEESPEAYVLNKRTLFRKIRETINLGGTQILIQGGLHPKLDFSYYVDLLTAIKKKFTIHVHGFSPPEIWHMADKSGIPLRKTLQILNEAGLDSIPGGGAEILSDRVRKKMATMMFGSIEKPEDIIEHLEAIRNLQDKTNGFTAFIPWSFQPGNTELIQKKEVKKIRRSEGKKTLTSQLPSFSTSSSPATAVEYLRVLARHHG
jgi:cyclic dehypoxanthinyl futalosine synthase